MVAGSPEPSFPSEDDRVRLSVCANQAGTVLQHWRAEKRLKESEMLWKEAQRLANVGSWNWNTASDMVHCSDEFYRIIGLEPQALPMPYDRILASIHADDRPRVENRIAQAP